MRHAALVPASLVLLAAADCKKPPSAATTELLAPLVDERGRTVGTVEAEPSDRGVALSVRAFALDAGDEWEISVRSGRSCTGHTFSEAGPPWTPPGASGSTVLGPLRPDERGRASLHATDPALTLAGRANGLDGRAVVLRKVGEGSPPRACGVLAPPPTQEIRVGGDQPEITDAWEL